MQPIYLICGVPGSGKTWVCRQLAHKSYYIPKDQHFKDHETVLIKAARTSIRPILTECPFGERPLREKLEEHGITVNPYFIIEEPETVRERYESRTKKKIPKSHLTHAVSILERAKEWDAPNGRSTEILKLLQDVLK